MKKYYISRGDFANDYRLYWADESNAQFVDDGMERISRKEALSLATSEADRRQYDQAFSGFASNRIVPVDFSLAGYLGQRVHDYDYDHYNVSSSRILEADYNEPRILVWCSDKLQADADEFIINSQAQLDKEAQEEAEQRAHDHERNCLWYC